MNENLFASFITAMMLSLPFVTLIVLFPSLLFPTSNQLMNNHLISLQQWMLQLVSKQMMSIHNSKAQARTLMLMSLILFIVSTNLLGLLPHSFTPTTELSMNLGMAIPQWAGAMITGFCNKTKASLAHFLPQGMSTPLIPMVVIIEIISLFIQLVVLAMRLTANITGHLLIHLIGGATLTLMNISTTTALNKMNMTILLYTY